jgi:hypothetical protein
VTTGEDHVFQRRLPLEERTMQRLLERLDERAAEYAAAPFLTFLRDPTVDPKRKLAFAPHVAHFVLTFGDLCTHILPEDPPSDPWQALVNANCREDDGHWRWYLRDLATLSYDAPVPYGDAIRTIWSDSTVRTRMLSYHLCHLALGADSIGKLMLVHCIEGAFKATVRDLQSAADQFLAATGEKLHYLGARHADAEESHTIERTDVRASIDTIQLEPEVYAALSAMVDRTFQLFRDFADEMLSLAEAKGLGSAKLDDPPELAVPTPLGKHKARSGNG